MKKEFVQYCVNVLKSKEDPRRIEAMKKWSKQFSWDLIAKKWDEVIR